MKILPVDKIREADKFTIINEPVADIDLMERAASTCVEWLLKNISREKTLKVFCGTGNNGGDGMVIARLMAISGYSTEVFIFGKEDKLSENSRTNYTRLLQNNVIPVHFCNEDSPFPVVSRDSDIVIDSLIGSGLSNPVKGSTGKLIAELNSGQYTVISIDVPSGLLCDESMEKHLQAMVVKATHTLTFAPLKLAFVFPENDVFIGRWHLLEIGISKTYLENVETRNYYTQREDLAHLVKPRNFYSHKGQFGHALLICGSTGKMGAAILGARSCLRSGAGLVTVHIPRNGNSILQTAVPEAMVVLDEGDNEFSSAGDISTYTSIAIGPGIGQSPQAARGLKHLIQNYPLPLILDADALNILSENKTWLSFLPRGSILTPHPKEFERIAGKTENHFERNNLQRELSVRLGIYIILKGAHSAVTTPDGSCFFNSTGNPGMATAGSGDVLTGIIAGLLAQGYSPQTTSLLGTYIHGLAGDFAANDKGYEALIAGDIIENLGNAFLSLTLT